ncbi:endoglucanase B [Massariosphaeria phaeospora]|uniref:AA9 family lytic polysaccharide monooxygenase n=1 Tax=Massariosphaeria phaeospora TaxID=100035 RepID=A0A7C8MG14_9PLEO|nr:endoglucanase B [Massariosphaeria phaeospora]
MYRPSVLLLALLQGQASAHTFIWGVFVNGVDQGLFKGIRTPAYNGPPGGGGFANSPVKDLGSIDLRCNVLGDIPAPDTIKVQPGDNLTFDWKHNYRNGSDDIIDKSHHGPSLVYISPDPPAENSFVKLWHQGLYEIASFPQPGKWSTTSNLAKNGGRMSIRIPKDLKAGYYLIRAEMIALHEGDADFRKSPMRGAQFYPNCVQIEVTGDGAVELPEGVSFPGAYSHDDPGVVHNKQTAPCRTAYEIPGPTVWSGAWQETTSAPAGEITGGSTAPLWSTWIKQSVVTSATFADRASPTVVGTSTFSAQWSSTYQTPAPATKRW